MRTRNKCSVRDFIGHLPLLALLPFFFFFSSQVMSSISPKKVVLNAQNGEEIRYLDPQLSSGVSSAHIAINLFSGLYEYDPKTGSPKKELVKDYSHNASFTQWTFKLHKNRYWVQKIGDKILKRRKVTAHDFVYSYRRMLSPDLASEYSYMLYIIKNGEKYNQGKILDAKAIGVKALDAHTLVLTTEGPIPSLIKYLPHHSFYPVPKEPIQKFKEKWIDKKNIWTNGPFTFDEWKLKEKISVVKNPHYPEASNIQLDQVNFKFIGGQSPESVLAFLAGKTDIDLMGPPTSEIGKMKKMGTLKAARQLGTYFIRINVKKIKDVRVRKAMALVVPRERIARYVTKSGQVPTVTFVPPSFSDYQPQAFTESKTYKERVQKAKKLMALAGHPNGKGLPELEYLYNTAETHEKIAVVCAKAWKEKLGIKVKPLNQEWKVYLNTQKSLDYHLARAGWVADMEDPLNFLEMFITGGGNNNTGYSNKKYDQLINQARIEGDVKKRNKYMQEAESILMKELPIIPVFVYTSLNMAHKYVKGFYANKFDQHPMKYIKVDLSKRKAMFPQRRD